MERRGENSSSVEPVQVFIRVRPDLLKNSGIRSSRSGQEGQKSLTAMDDKSIRISPPDGHNGSRKSVPAVDDKIFTYDAIFNTESSQEHVYERVSQHVRAAIQGYNTTIFALGCTGSGKTYTMTGTSSAPGIIPRAISEIFSIIEATAAHESDVFFYVRLSFVELYNNNFRNLLDFAAKDLDEKGAEENSRPRNRPTSPTTIHPNISSSRPDKIEVRESQSAGVFLAGHNLRIPVTTAQEAFKLINRGLKNRATGSTQCNDISSRSHAILTLHVESRIGEHHADNTGGASSAAEAADVSPAELRLGKIHLVDLAGSERVAMSGAEGETLVETQSINLSLTALGDVLSALSRNAAIKNHQHSPRAGSGGGRPGSGPRSPGGGPPMLVPVPYRNSKLTHLLKDSLGGNSKTIMITTVHTQAEYYHQTMVSLKYASRAKKVKNRSLVNRDVIGDSGIHAVSSEIERLRNRLDARTMEFDRLRGVHIRDAKENQDLKTRLQEMHEANEREKAELEAQMSRVIHSQAGELATQKKKLSSLQSALQEELAVSQNKIAEQEKEINWLKKALDETSQAVVQPIEQLERVQRVADAWQIQAKHAQDELQLTSSQLHEQKSINSAVSSNLSDTVLSNKRLQEELAECTARLDEERKENGRLRAESSALKKELDISKVTINKMSGDLKDRDSRAATEASTIRQLQSEISTRLAELESLRSELAQRESSFEEKLTRLEREKQHLTRKLTDSVSEIESKLTESVMNSTERILELEEQKKAAEDKIKVSNKEMEILKLRILDIHGNVETVTKDRESTIVRLTESLESNEVIRKELYQKYITVEERRKETSREVSRLKEELTATTEALSIAHRDREKAETVHKAAIQELKIAHKAAVEKMKSEHAKQMHELHEHSTVEIVKFRDDISSAVVNQQESTRKRHDEELQQLTIEKDREREEAISCAVEETKEELRREHTAVINQLEEQYAKNLKEQVSVALRNARESARSEWEATASADTAMRENEHAEALGLQREEMQEGHRQAIEQLHLIHDEQIQRLKEQHAHELEVMEMDLITIQEESVSAATRSAMEEKDLEIQEIRSKHFELMEETEKVYAEKLEAILSDKAAIIERHKEIVERLREERLTVETELESKFTKQMQLTIAEHKEAMDSMKKQASVARGEEKMSLIAQHEQRVARLQEEVRAAAQRELAEQLEALEAKHVEDVSKWSLDAQRATEAAVDEALSLQREKLTAEFAESNRQGAESQQKKLEAEVELQVKEALAHAHEHFSRSQQAREIALQGEREAALSHVRVQYEDEMEQVRLEHMQLRSKAEDDYRERLTENLQSMRAELDRKHNDELTSLRESLNRENRAHLAELQMQFEREAADASGAQQATLKSVQQEVEMRMRSLHEDELRRLEVTHSEVLENLRRSLTDEHSHELTEQAKSFEAKLSHTMNTQAKLLEENTERLMADGEAALQELRTELESRHCEEINTLKTAMASEGTEAILLLQSQHEEAVAREQQTAAIFLQEKLEQQQQSLQEDYNERMSEVLATLEDQTLKSIAEMEARHKAEVERQVADLRTAHATELAEAVSSLRAELEAQHVQSLSELRMIHNEELQEAEKKRVEETDRLLSEKDSSVSEVLSGLRLEHEERLASLQRQHEDEKVSIRTEMECALSSLRSELEIGHATSLADALSAEKHRAESTFETTLTETLQLQKMDMEESLEMRITEALQQQKVELESDFEATLVAKLDELEQESRAVQERSTSEAVDSVRAEHEAAMAAQQLHFNEKLRTIAQETDDAHQTAMAEFEIRLRTEAAEALQAEKSMFTEEVLILRAAHDEALLSLREEVEGEMNEKMRLAFAESEKNAQDRLLAAERALNATHQTEMDDFSCQLAAEMERQVADLRTAHATELAEAVSSLRAELEAQHVQSLSELRMIHNEELQEAEKKRVEETDRLLSEKDSSVSEVLSGLRLEHEERLASLQRQHEAEKAVAVQQEHRELEEVRMRELKELQNEMDETNATFETTLNEMADRHRAELESNSAALRIRLEDSHASVMAEQLESLRHDLQSRHELDISNQLEAQRLEMEQKHAGEMSILSNQGAEALAVAVASYQKDLDEMRNDLTEAKKQTGELLDAQLHQTEEKSRAELAEQKSRLLRDKEDAVLALQLRMREADEAARLLLSESLEEQQDRLTKLRHLELAQADERSNDVKVALQADVARLQQSVESLEAALSASRETMTVITEREEALSVQLQELQQQNSSLSHKLETTETAYAEELAALEDSLRCAHEAQVSDIKTAHIKEMSAAASDHQREIEDLHMQLGSVSLTHKRELETLRSKLSSEMSAKWAEEENALRTRHNEELSTMRESLTSARAQLASSAPSDVLVEMRKQHADELACCMDDQQRLKEMAVQSVKEQYSNEILRITSIQKDEVDSLKIQTDRSIDELKAKLHRLTQELLDRDARISNLTDTISAHQEETDRRESRMRTLAQEYQSRVEVTQKSFDEAIDEMSRRHSDEVKSLKGMLQTAQQRCLTLQENIDVLQASATQNSTPAGVSKDGHSHQMQAIKESYESEISTLTAAIVQLETSSKDATSRSEAAYAKLLCQLTEAQDKLAESSQRAAMDIHTAVVQLKAKHAEELASTSQKCATLEDKLIVAERELQEARTRKPTVQMQVDPALAATMKMEFEKELSVQREKMQNQYLSMLQDQMGTLMAVVKSSDKNTSLSKVEEMRGRFLSMIENLPDTLRNQLRADIGDPVAVSANARPSLPPDAEVGGSSSVVSSIGGEEWADAVPRSSRTTDIDSMQDHYRQLEQQMQGRRSAQIVDKALDTVTWSGLSGSARNSSIDEASGSYDASSRRHLTEIDHREADSKSRRVHHVSRHHSQSVTTSTRQQQLVEEHTSITSTSRQLHHTKRTGETFANSQQVSSRSRGIGGAGNWTSFGLSAPSSTPIDQLIAAILDGDVQGIRSVVRSRGDSLHSEFWAEIAHTVLPLHRAISGLHFHGNHRTLVQTLEALVQLGADVSAQDHTGNSVLHKAIQVCTSTSVVDVVKSLLRRGAPCNSKNSSGQTPLHAECSRARTATVHVINSLLQEGADPNALMQISIPNGQSVAVSPLYMVLQTGAQASGPQHDHVGEAGTFGDDSVLNSSALSVASGHGSASLVSASRPSRMRSSGARSWVKAAHALVKAGAAWSGHMCIAKGQTQLYLLLKAFPPPREDVHTYRSLLAACLASLSSSDDASPLTEDEQGRSALFVLCEQMSHVSQDAFPEATSMLKMVLEHAGGSIGGADRSGRTVFDLEEQVAEDAEIPYSCLRAARQLLVHAGTKSGAGRIISANGHTGVRAAAVISKSVSATVSAESSNRTDKSAQHHYSSNRRQHHTTED